MKPWVETDDNDLQARGPQQLGVVAGVEVGVETAVEATRTSAFFWRTSLTVRAGLRQRGVGNHLFAYPARARRFGLLASATVPGYFHSRLTAIGRLGTVESAKLDRSLAIAEYWIQLASKRL